jgi:putative ABC transport system permease protein
MGIFQIALSNIKRRKVKMLFIVLGLIVGVATIVAFTNILTAMELDFGNRIDELGANAVILPRTEGTQGHGSNILPDMTIGLDKLTMDDIPKIYGSSVVEYINIVSPKLIGSARINGQKALLVGVEPRNEFTQKPWITLRDYMGQGTGMELDLALMEIPEDSVIIGSKAAKALGLEVGNDLVINDEPFKLFGILNELGSEEDGLIYANLGVVQGLLNRPSELSMIEVSAYCNFCPIEEIAMGLEEALGNSRVIPLRQAALFREETINQFASFGYSLSGMVLLIAALIVLTTMLSSVNERTREIGILRAIGFRRIDIISIIYLESLMISILGGLIGFSLGSLIAYYEGPHLAQINVAIPVNFEPLIPAVIISVVLAIVGSSYPAIKAAQLDPAEALRFM